MVFLLRKCLNNVIYLTLIIPEKLTSGVGEIMFLDTTADYLTHECLNLHMVIKSQLIIQFWADMVDLFLSH